MTGRAAQRRAWSCRRPTSTRRPSKALAKLAGAERIDAVLARRATRRSRSRRPRDCAERRRVLRAARRCDCAFVPPRQRLDRVRVVAMDMDSTLITIECIDEIADLQGIKPQVAAITASAMRGEIDFRAEPDAPRGAARGLAGRRRWSASTTSACALSPGAERMLAGVRAVGAQDAARLRRLHVLHRSAARRGSGSTTRCANTLEIVDGKLTGRVAGRDRRRRGEGGVLRAPARGARRATTASSSRSATARTTCRCWRRPTSVDRLSREAGRARAGDARDRPLRAGRRAQSVRVASRRSGQRGAQERRRCSTPRARRAPPRSSAMPAKRPIECPLTRDKPAACMHARQDERDAAGVQQQRRRAIQSSAISSSSERRQSPLDGVGVHANRALELRVAAVAEPDAQLPAPAARPAARARPAAGANTPVYSALINGIGAGFIRRSPSIHAIWIASRIFSPQCFGIVVEARQRAAPSACRSVKRTVRGIDVRDARRRARSRSRASRSTSSARSLSRS